MIVVLLFLNFLLMLAMPLVLGWQLQRRWQPGWRLFGIGAVTFVVSQIFHIPFEEMLGLPLYMGLLGAVERVFALTVQMALSLLVMQAFVRGKMRWLAAAVLWHALVDAAAVFAITTWGALTTEGLIGIMALISLGIIYWLYQPEPKEPEVGPLPEPGPLEAADAPPTQDALERSKYFITQSHGHSN